MDPLEDKAFAYQKFRSILENKASLQPLAESQFFEAVNVFQNLALEAALKRVERARQEIYLASSINRTSVLSQSQDRQYNPRPPSPSIGQVKITNHGSSAVGLPAETELLSDDQLPYVLADAVAVNPQTTVVATAIQAKQQQIEFTVEQQQPFTEFLLDA